MESNVIKISGPVYLSVLRDPDTDRYFYLFGDHHASMEGACSSQQPGLKCDRPNFLFSDVVTGDSNCWTISALLHEVFEYYGKEGVTVDFYRERSKKSADFDSTQYAYIYEILQRRQGIYKEPRSREQLQVMKERLSSTNYGWIEDSDSMLWNKKYPPSVEIIDANARRYNNFQVVPAYDTREFRNFMDNVKETIQTFSTTNSSDGYEFAMNGIIESIEDILSLAEQLTAAPFELMEHHFVPKDYVESTRNLIHYIPTASSTCKKLVEDLYKSLSTGYGERSKTGQVASLSAASWARLRRANASIAEVLLVFMKSEIEQRALDYMPKIALVSDIISSIDFRDPDNMVDFINILNQIYDCLNMVVVLNAHVMDHYTLSEMLRRTAKHNILFAGGEHTRTCTKFLSEELGYELIENVDYRFTEDGIIRCVESSSIRKLLSLDKAREYQRSK